MKVDVLQPAVARRASTRPARGSCCTASTRAATASASTPTRRPTRSAGAATPRSPHYPATEGHHLDPDPRARPRAPGRDRATRPSRCRPRCASPSGLPDRAARRSPRPTSATTRAAGGAWPSTSCCSTSSSCCAARAQRRATLDAPRAGRRADADARAGATSCCPSRRRATSGARWTTSTPTSPRDRPMQRLLMGEVGSGKTVVALHAMLRAVEHGCQAALMAPTETLAEQHFATLQALMPGAAVAGRAADRLDAGGAARATSSASSRRGELSLVVGTHALIEDTVVFDRPRRRRRRRAAPLRRAPARARWTPRRGRGPRPARPAHDRHADPAHAARWRASATLDVTALRELPRGRRPIETHVVLDRARARRAPTSASARSCAPAARRYVVCPLVERVRGAAGARAATAEFERLRTASSRDFERRAAPRPAAPAREGRGDGSASPRARPTCSWPRRSSRSASTCPTPRSCSSRTPTATASRQLHQLRGRIGRGEHASLCLLFGPRESRAPAGAGEQHRDGFRLAEIDLELRGEGELTGTRQSGARALPLRPPARGRRRCSSGARGRAETLLDADPELAAPEHALLRDALRARTAAADRAAIAA